jgi:hypothetical protein
VQDQSLSGNIRKLTVSDGTLLQIPEDIMTSSPFFDGPNVKPTRLMNSTSTADKMKLYKKVILRHKWVQHLKKTLSHWIIQKMKPMNYSLGPITSDHLLIKYINFILSLHPKVININYSTLSPFYLSHSVIIALFATQLGHPTILLVKPYLPTNICRMLHRQAVKLQFIILKIVFLTQLALSPFPGNLDERHCLI